MVRVHFFLVAAAVAALSLAGASCDQGRGRDAPPLSVIGSTEVGNTEDANADVASAEGASAEASHPACAGDPIQLAGPFAAATGFAYRVSVPVDWRSDSTEGPRVSSLVLIEDGRELGPRHTAHDAIRSMGRGAFSHWNGALYFSTSDGSDPNENGRRYELACREGARTTPRATRGGYPLPPQSAELVLDPPFLHRDGFAWTIPVPQDWPSDGMHAGARSKVVVLEDGNPIGPAHAEHLVIERVGEGRFSHWEGLLHFSASDNSDPNHNGRQYTARFPVRPGLGEFGYRPLPRIDPFESLGEEANTSLPAVGSPPPGRTTVSASARPKVIYWYTIDAIRSDVVDAELNGQPVMPALSQFRQESVSFSAAFVNASNTKMSTATMFTGLWPTRHRVMAAVLPVWPLGGEFALGLDHRYYTLAEAMRDAGYETWTHHYTVFIKAGSGLLQGFDHDDLADAQPVAIPNPADRFFAYEHILGAHAPYFPSQGTIDHFGLAVATHVDPAGTTWYTEKLSADAVAELKDYYLADAYEADRLFAERMQWLRDEGRWDDAVIIVTADHGEEFLEHGRTTHSTQVYQEAVHVPLMIKFPKQSPYASSHGSSLPNRVSMVDLYPTLVELLQIDSVPYALDGRSLLPVLRDEEEPNERKVIMRMAANLNRKRSGGMFLFVTDAIASGNLKAIFGYRIQDSQSASVSDRQGDWIAELYDLENDPGETRNLARERPDDFLRLAQEHFATNGPLTLKGHSENAAEDGTPMMDDELMSRLKQLGYVE